MTLHKVFRELFDLSPNDIWDIKELIEVAQEAKAEFEKVGVPFNYEKFKEYMHRNYEPRITQYNQNHAQASADSVTRQLKIVDGDNLDAIEEAAKDKGLI